MEFCMTHAAAADRQTNAINTFSVCNRYMSLRTARDLEQVITKLGLDWPVDRMQRPAEDDGVKFPDHLAGAELAEVATAPSRRALGMFLGQFGEICT